MLSDRIGAKARGLQDQPPLSVAEKLLLLEGRTLENGGSIQIEQPGKRDL